MVERALVDGVATGEVLVLDEPLSIWGGLDPETGRIVDVRHPQRGASVAGRVLVLPAGRGSSSASTVLAESIRVGTGPAAVVLGAPDEILALGSIVAEELYGAVVPVVVVDDADRAALATGQQVTVGPGPRVRRVPA